MRVLVVTNMYPDDRTPFYGIFVKEQMDAVTALHPDVNYDVYFADGRVSKINYLKSIFHVGRLISSGDYDLVHIHYGLSGLFMLNPLRRRIPTILTLHGGDIQIEQGKKFQVPLTRCVIKKCDLTITLNDRMSAICDTLKADYRQIPCSVNTDLFTPLADTRKSKSITNSFSIVFPGNPERMVKNYPLYQSTISLLRNKYNLNVKEVILNNMSREEVVATLQDADMLLMTSISEGSPQVVKEAMATNLPVISTDVGDVRTLLDGVSGSAVVNDSTPEALSEKVIESISNQIHGINGRDKIFSLGLDDTATANKLYRLYQQIIS